MDSPTINPYEPVTVDPEIFDLGTTRTSVLRVAAVFVLATLGVILLGTGIMILASALFDSIAIRPFHYFLAALLLYLGTGTSLCLGAVFVFTRQNKRAIFSLSLAVLIPVTLFSLLGF